MRSWLLVLLLAGMTLSGWAQSGQSEDSSASQQQDGASQRGVRLKYLPRDILQDQGALLTSPLRMGERQWKLAVPLGFLAVGLVASDTAVEAHVTKSASTVSHASTFSNGGLGTLIGVGGTMYVWGSLAKNEHQRETGFLSGEAAIDAYLDSTLISSVAGRDRPFTANGRGQFFDGGSSFVSHHSAVSWAIASVIAHEYPGPATKFFAYGMAAAVSMARVEAHQHFMSDAVLGSALGWYIGRQIYRARGEDAEIDVRKWGTFERDEHSAEERVTSQMGSSYVPIDSWMYGAFDRLEAMGYIVSGSSMVRPWTRLNSAHLLAEAHESADEEDTVAAPLLAALDAELAPESGLMEGGQNTGAKVESLYGRFTGIAGTPLRDSFHFAQTLVDDNGRPYGQGANAIAGVSTRAEAGPLAFYLSGEYQYASAIPLYNAAAQQTIAASDGLPFGWNLRAGTTSRFRTIEAYAALNLSDWQLSFGQQALWDGPGRNSSMILSNNAEAMPMLRLARVRALELPLLGKIHGDFFLAREGGIHYVELGPTFVLHGNASQSLDPPPYVWGVSFSMKPTENLELGISHTAIFAGYGRPLNLKTFLHTFSSSGNNQAVDPGKRAESFNFSYHIPGLRKWLVLYNESFVYDSPTDRVSFSRYSFNPGVYLPQIPGLRRLDLRVEGVDTNLPGLKDQAYFYANAHYPQGYTNYGQIFGGWIGRQGSGGSATSTYWFTARNRATVSYRRTLQDKSFLQGGTLEDFSGSVTWMLRPSIEFTAKSQYERWNFPLLATGAKDNVATSFEIRVFPKGKTGGP